MNFGLTVTEFSFPSSKVGSVIIHIMEMLDLSMRLRSRRRFLPWGKEKKSLSTLSSLPFWPMLTSVLYSSGVETEILSYLQKEKRKPK